MVYLKQITFTHCIVILALITSAYLNSVAGAIVALGAISMHVLFNYIENLKLNAETMSRLSEVESKLNQIILSRMR